MMRASQSGLRLSGRPGTVAPAATPPDRCKAHKLGLCGSKQRVGLDFVRYREYGRVRWRLRWLEYPAETIEIDETEEPWPFPS